ncbi:uncharacterized protein LOC129975716 isoform X2 [Argiope bruennichi]|uniref:uncharacterized protein LOC129975716 isoform X2 n=1 Tax=Argiope bruennichi TaxID=94029 RepID=UPI0024954867|nr:uncharacterized protein LOC129975716 isoform X2 [Argiope bruennichi]
MISDTRNGMAIKRNRRFDLLHSEYQLPVEWKSSPFLRRGPRYYNLKYEEKKGIYRKRDDSGWSKWGRWDCPVTCGGGIAERVRFCRVSGHCDGPRIERRKCAENPCPEGAPPFMIDEAKRQISYSTTSIRVQKGEKIQMDCEGNMARDIKIYFRKAKGIWYHNEEIFYPEKERVGLLDNYKLYFAKALSKDNGVWYCETKLDPKASIYTAVYTIAVESDVPDIEVKVGKSFSMPCNNVPLSKFFSLKLVTEWYHNASLYEKFENSKPKDVQELAIKSSTFEDSGIWMCKVKEQDEKSGRIIREWATNVVRVNVLESGGNTLEEYSLAISVIALVLVFVLGIVIYYCIRSRRKRAKKKVKMLDVERGSADKKSHDRRKGKPGEGHLKGAPKKIARKELEKQAKKVPKRDIEARKRTAKQKAKKEKKPQTPKRR